ncbi:MAG: phosphate signaling complex protein PhoU [Candidatus Thorarchaeota archaeon]
MAEKFHEDLAQLKTNIIEMGKLAKDMLCKAVLALKNQDTILANSIIADKDKILDMDDEIEAKALQLLTLYQPMGVDIRTIGASLKIITYLTRVGRYGKDIAKIAITLSDEPPLAKLVSIPYMQQKVCEMLSDAINAYDTKELSKINPENFIKRDNDIDALRYSIFRECISYMMEDPKNISRCANYVMVARYLERCGDHACKIAEKAHYMVNGKRVEIS